MDKKEIAEFLSKFVNLKKEEIGSILEIPPSSELGDFSFPCFKLSGILKKSPVEIARQLEKEIKPKGNINQIKAQGPYLNIFLRKEIFAEKVLDIDDNYGRDNLGKNKKVVIDFSAPNIGKPMHIGHIRSTIVGDSLMRLYDFLGYQTVGINYMGDIGLHIGKLIVAYELWLDKKALDKDPVAELLRLYVKFCEKEKSELTEGSEEASDTQDYSDNEWTNRAKEKLKLIELGDKRAHEIWKEIREKSQKGFDRVYKMLDVNFNETTGQSKFSDAGKEIIVKAQKKGIAKIDKETGAVYVEFIEKGKEILPKKYVLRSNGTASYITQDIGAAVEREKNYKFDKMIYVTDYRQSLHFKQLFKILNSFGYNFSDKCSHVAFGTVNFGKEIIATRAGRIVLLEDVLKKTVEKAEQEIKKRKTKGDPESIGIGAVKYIILRNEPIKDVEFSWDAALNFEGDSGPYLQYSYARASSILKKAKYKESKNLKVPEKLEQGELDLIKKILDFPSIVKKSSDDLNPSLIAKYSFELAQLFNEFYMKCKVIDGENEAFRLKLVDSFRKTIKNSLYLLGIEVMEEM